MLTSFNAFSNSSDSIFIIGNNYYENEFYEKAIESYLSVDSTEHAHALYHNIGNCYYQTGDIASSILFYERALLLKNDLQTKENLNLAKKRIQEIESIPKLSFQTLSHGLFLHVFLYGLAVFYSLYFWKTDKKELLIFYLWL